MCLFFLLFLIAISRLTFIWGYTINFFPWPIYKVNIPQMIYSHLHWLFQIPQSCFLAAKGGTYPQCYRPEHLLYQLHHFDDPGGVQSYLLLANGAAVKENIQHKSITLIVGYLRTKSERLTLLPLAGFREAILVGARDKK